MGHVLRIRTESKTRIVVYPLNFLRDFTPAAVARLSGRQKRQHARRRLLERSAGIGFFERMESRCMLSVTGPSYDIGTPTLTDVWVNPVSGNDANTGSDRTQALRTVTAA